MKQLDEELEREKMRERSLSASKRVQVRVGAFRRGCYKGNPLVR